MIETLTALFFAHVLADFVFQNRWMVRHKRNPLVILLHILIVLACACAALGLAAVPALLALATLHLAIDLVKTYGARDSAAAFLLDQIAHLAVIGGIALYAPGLWNAGLWAAQTEIAAPLILHLMALTGGGLYAIRAGGFAVGKLMAPFGADFTSGGLPSGGLMIGLLERGLIYLLVLFGQAASIGFLIAAKSVMRFETASKEQKAAEYVIIGTLASFGWALAVTMGVMTLRSALPALEIAPSAH
ncbi:DUF3307 domain-containing protein [Pseudooceanicola sp.]|uniref:DUF3307 domain-containing protein n=1 Tax=Pseudooceanicola sp. TaxID=1914328 RepID=UPI00260C28CC|nr:DUF3307 domain-containing protein [Pseudooceanicola sp.]MDF1853852.1 DUF3307 domain-containing protein [Pseudooceanicola sp.]